MIKSFLEQEKTKKNREKIKKFFEKNVSSQNTRLRHRKEYREKTHTHTAQHNKHTHIETIDTIDFECSLHRYNYSTNKVNLKS